MLKAGEQMRSAYSLDGEHSLHPGAKSTRGSHTSYIDHHYIERLLGTAAR